MVRRWRRVQGMGKFRFRNFAFRLLGGHCADGDAVAGGILAVEGDDDFLGGGGGHGKADVVGGDGHEVVATVDEDGEFDLRGAAVVEEFVECGLDGAAGEEDVVDEDDVGAVDVGREHGGRELFGDRIAADVVAMKGDVDDAGEGFELGGEGDQAGGKAAGEENPAVGDTEKNETGIGAVSGDDGLGDLVDGGVNIFGADSFGRGHGKE